MSREERKSNCTGAQLTSVSQETWSSGELPSQLSPPRCSAPCSQVPSVDWTLEAASHESALWQPDGVSSVESTLVWRDEEGSRLEAWDVYWLLERPLCGCGKSFGALIAQVLFYSYKSFLEWTWLPEYTFIFYFKLPLVCFPPFLPECQQFTYCVLVQLWAIVSSEAVSHLYQETHKHLFNEQRHTLSLLKPWFPAVSSYKES